MYFKTDDVPFIGKILLSILLPLWLYWWFRKVIDQRSDSKSNFPNISFLLKRWWAECSIGMKKRERINSYDRKGKPLENLRIKDKNSTNTLLFYGADQKGNSLFIKFSRRGFQTIETSLRLTTSEGQLYVLPAYPDTTSTNRLNQGWTGAGIKIELLEAEKRWRIIYNGMLRNFTPGDESNEKNVQHIRLNLLFIANSKPLRWPDDWSPRLHAEALAREPWKNPEWMNKIKLLDHVGFDQFGSILGQVTYKDGFVSTMYLRGLHQSRWGKHESHEFHKSFILFGVMPCGAMYHLEASDTKHSFPRILCGQFRDNNESIRKIDKIEMKLFDFDQEKFTDGSKWKIRLTVEGKEYDILAEHVDPITLHYGEPWNWNDTIATAKLNLNGRPGVGLAQIRHPYTGSYQAKPPTKLSRLRQPYSHVDRTDYIARFDDGKCENESIVGGKGFSLAVLTSVKDTDFIVPKGFCVTIFALDFQLQTHKALQKAVNDIEDVSVGKKDGDLEKYCNEAVRIIRSTPVAEEVRNAIVEAVEVLEEENDDDDDKPIKYAIRSSAVGEDSEETSAAGQNATYLGIEGSDGVVKNVAMCWASLFSYQSVKYRKQHGLFVKSSMGVCVQKMVNADAAGVIFTRHPTSGDPSNIVITSNYGLGETVVSAAVDPDTIVIHRGWNDELTVESVTAGNKKEKLSTGRHGLITSELDDEEKKAISISEHVALRLAAVALNLEILFNDARDIEWAVKGEQIYLLQARPITTLYSWTEFELLHELDSGVPSDIDLITFSNVGEVLPNPLSPLTISILAKAFNEGVIHAYDDDEAQFMPVVGMRIASNYYNTLLRYPGKEVTITNKVCDIALCGRVVITPEMNGIAVERNGVASFARRIRTTYGMLMDTIKNASVEDTAREICQKLTLNPEGFHTAYSLYNRINQRYPEYLRITECHMHTSRVSIIYQMLAMVVLTKDSEDFLPDHFSDIALLLGSCKHVIGAELLAWLNKIINYIKKSEKDEEFKKLDPTKAIDWLKINCPLAGKELENLLREQGHRCIQEMDFLTEPWSLEPKNLVVMLQALTTGIRETNINKTLTANETVACLKTPTSAVSKLLLQMLVPYCREAVARREKTKSLLVNVIHKFRLAYRRLGKLMTLEEYLPNQDLVFFLTNQEIGETLNHRRTTLVQRASRRKRIFPRIQQLRYQEFNTGMPIPVKSNLNADATTVDGSIKVQGTSVCGGSVLNRACVITDFSDAHKIQQADILITRATDIAWSPYFPLLSGIVTELGGLISHGAVVAREYGLPCIVGAKNATEVFETGDTVLLVGDTGVLQLVEKLQEEKSVEKTLE